MVSTWEHKGGGNNRSAKGDMGPHWAQGVMSGVQERTSRASFLPNICSGGTLSHMHSACGLEAMKRVTVVGAFELQRVRDLCEAVIGARPALLPADLALVKTARREQRKKH